MKDIENGREGRDGLNGYISRGKRDKQHSLPLMKVILLRGSSHPILPTHPTLASHPTLVALLHSISVYSTQPSLALRFPFN